MHRQRRRLVGHRHRDLTPARLLVRAAGGQDTFVHALELVRTAYQPLLSFADTVDEDTGWAATRLPGWTVRELLVHLAADCQRALVALATPADGPADTDDVSYWTHWQPGSAGAAAGLRGTRIMASAWSSVHGPATLYAETARAVLVAGEKADGSEVVTTQGRRLTVESLLRTLCVEATVHHLDLADVLTTGPEPAALHEVRRVLDGLLGQPAPAAWDDTRYALVGTGRAELTGAERDELGAAAERIPLFG
jgi:Mycothiol maleylpyruvate isomerase N-terminal domain